MGPIRKESEDNRMNKQKWQGIGMIVVGWLTVPIDMDITFAAFATLMGLGLIFTKEESTNE